MGKTIKLGGRFERDFVVSGVIQNTPQTTHLKFNILLSMSSIKEIIEGEKWNNFNYYTYITVNPNTNISQLKEKIKPFYKEYIGESTGLRANLQAVNDIHLHSNFTFEPEIHGNAEMVSIIEIISYLILLIAIINYVNLSTAKSVNRAKEVGLRKTVGANKGQLITQFFIESGVMFTMSIIIGILLIFLIHPYFNSLAGKMIITASFFNIILFVKTIGLLLGGTLISGFYPALIISSYEPQSILKGSFKSSKRGKGLRKSLVFIQFCLSIILLSGTFIVFQQLNFMKSKDKGIDTSQLVGIDFPMSEDNADNRPRLEMFKNEVLNNNSIKNFSFMNSLPGGESNDISSTSGGLKLVGETERMEGTVYINIVDKNFLETVNLPLLAGRNVKPEIASDSNAVLINRMVLKFLNYPDLESALNKEIQFGTNPENTKYTIVGIVDDFHRSSFKSPLEPTLYYGSEYSGRGLVKLNSESQKAGLIHLNQVWNKVYPDYEFDYIFSKHPI